MFTRLDHLMICTSDLGRGVEQYRKLGFNIQMGGVHPEKGTHNAIALMEEDYLELLAILNPAEQRASAKPGTYQHGLERYITDGGGIRYVIIQSDDLVSDVAAMRSRSVDVSDAIDAGRRTPRGLELKWKTATLGPKNPLPIFFIQHQTPMVERRKQLPDQSPHPNGVRFLERTYIVVNDLEAEVALYAKALGTPAPRRYKGTVIMSHMAAFQFGPA